MRSALIFDWGRRSQENAGTFRTRKGTVFVVVIIVTPRHVVWDQIPAVIRLVLDGLRKGWASGRGDSVDRREGGTTGAVSLSGLLEAWGKIERKESEVGSEFSAIVLNLEGERGERHREGHFFEAREGREGGGVWGRGEGRVLIYEGLMIGEGDWLANLRRELVG